MLSKNCKTQFQAPLANATLGENFFTGNKRPSLLGRSGNAKESKFDEIGTRGVTAARLPKHATCCYCYKTLFFFVTDGGKLS
jgi:hypothetical protein